MCDAQWSQSKNAYKDAHQNSFQNVKYFLSGTFGTFKLFASTLASVKLNDSSKVVPMGDVGAYHAVKLIACLTMRELTARLKELKLQKVGQESAMLQESWP